MLQQKSAARGRAVAYQSEGWWFNFRLPRAACRSSIGQDTEPHVACGCIHQWMIACECICVSESVNVACSVKALWEINYTRKVLCKYSPFTMYPLCCHWPCGGYPRVFGCNISFIVLAGLIGCSGKGVHVRPACWGSEKFTAFAPVFSFPPFASPKF